MNSAIIANGKRYEVQLPCTIEAFLIRRGLPPRSVVVEWNGNAVAASEFGEIALSDGDSLEIVRIVAGGNSDHFEKG